jgi:hypothetical protein
MDPSSQFLYAGGFGTGIAGFTIDQTTGNLMPVPDSPFDREPVAKTSMAIASRNVPFAALSARVEIEHDDEFEVRATFTLGAGSNGIAPLTEDIKLGVGTFSITIPAGSFTQDGGRQFKFEGVIAGVTLKVEIKDLGGGSFELKAEGEGANLTGTVNPVTVALTIGDDVGSATTTAKFN